jgi:hypothetical protein
MKLILFILLIDNSYLMTPPVRVSRSIVGTDRVHAVKRFQSVFQQMYRSGTQGLSDEIVPGLNITDQAVVGSSFDYPEAGQLAEPVF